MPQQQNNPRFDNYIPVHERIEKFYIAYPEGRIITSIVEHDKDDGFILMRAEAYRTNDDALPGATGHAYEVRSEGYVNKTSYIENCESSSVGRALAMLGFEVKRDIASREEMQKSERQPVPTSRSAVLAATTPPDIPTPNHEQLETTILSLCEDLGYSPDKLQKWISKKYETDGSLDSLSIPTKIEVVELFVAKRAELEAQQEEVTA